MLQCLRKPTRTRYLWIDAICLNQADLAEKAVQIPLIGDVYKQARKTHIYLRSQILTSSALNLFHSFHRIHDFYLDGKTLDSKEIHDFDLDGRTFDATDEERNGGLFSQVFQALVALVQDPWFRRRWILQEVAVSHHAIIRTRGEAMPWQLFTKISGYFTTKSPSRFIDPNTADSTVYAMSVVAKLGTQDDHKDILELLERFHASECSDPRDRVYSLYSLVRQQWSLPKANYALNYVDIYAEVVLDCSNISESWWKFGSLWHVDSSLPSWIPNWSRSHIETIHPEVQWFEMTRKVEKASSWLVERVAKVTEVFQPLGSATSMQELARLMRPIHLDTGRPDYDQVYHGVRIMFEALISAGASHYWEPFLFDFVGQSQRYEIDDWDGPRGYYNTLDDRLFFNNTRAVLSTWNKLMKNSALGVCRSTESNGSFMVLVPASAVKNDIIVKIGKHRWDLGQNAVIARHVAVIRKARESDLSGSLLGRIKQSKRQKIDPDVDYWHEEAAFHLLGRADGLILVDTAVVGSPPMVRVLLV
jgi:hypothetical protein